MSETTETASVTIDTLKARLAELEEAQRKEGQAITQAEVQIANAKANRQARAGRIAELKRLISPPTKE